MITDVWLVLRLVDEYGWSIDECEGWMVDTLTRTVLKPMPSARPSSPGE